MHIYSISQHFLCTFPLESDNIIYMKNVNKSNYHV
jgi:hypothetical protein